MKYAKTLITSWNIKLQAKWLNLAFLLAKTFTKSLVLAQTTSWWTGLKKMIIVLQWCLFIRAFDRRSLYARFVKAPRLTIRGFFIWRDGSCEIASIFPRIRIRFTQSSAVLIYGIKWVFIKAGFVDEGSGLRWAFTNPHMPVLEYWCYCLFRLFHFFRLPWCIVLMSIVYNTASIFTISWIEPSCSDSPISLAL